MKDISSFEGLYAITEDGQVWSYRNSRFLQPVTVGKGYLGVGLSRNRIVFPEYVHRLVASAFIDNPEGKRTVNHKDGNKKNNHVSNLEWATHQEQIDHAISTGLMNVVGENNGYSKLNGTEVEEIRIKYSSKKFSHEQLAEQYNVTRACILKVIRGRTWTHLQSDSNCDSHRWKDRGASHGSARWSQVQVREMRMLYASGNYTTRQLVKIYGGHPSGVWSVVNFKSYTNQDHDLMTAYNRAKHEGM
jgi:hypothetical protein